MSQSFWGSNANSEIKPVWPWVSEYIGYANCFATEGGWSVRWPWGDEVIVALSNLTTKLGTANAVNLLLGSATPAVGWLTNAATQTVRVDLCFNEAVHVTGTPTLALISEVGAANGGSPANITLSYNASASSLETGKVAFSNQNFSLASVGYGVDTLVANSTSAVTNFNTIHDAASGAAVATSIPAALSLEIPVYQVAPIQTLDTRIGSAKDTSGQYLGFLFTYSSPVTVTGTPYLNIFGPNTDIANLVAYYNSANSNLAAGEVAFITEAQNFHLLTGNAQFTLNASSANASSGLDGIKDYVVPGNPRSASATVAVGNTFTVVQNEPFFSALLDGADVTNALAQVVTFGIKFDRAAVVTGGTPTVLAIGTDGLANLTLSYASGNGTTNLVFSSLATDLTAKGNGTWVINASSTLTGFGYISNTGVVVEATSIAGSAANVVALVSA